MSSAQTYARVDVFVGSLLLMEEQTIEVTQKSNSQPVATQQKAYAGESPGAEMIEITFTNAQPVAGAEIEFDQYMAPLTFLEITLKKGNEYLTTTGTVYETTLSAGVDQPTKGTAKFRGSFAKWST